MNTGKTLEVTDTTTAMDVMRHLAQRSRDPSVPVDKRLHALVMLSEIGADVIMEGLRQEASAPRAEKKPEFKWVNGAKVRV